MDLIREELKEEQVGSELGLENHDVRNRFKFRLGRDIVRIRF
jgi:hypothetical protein